jgi:large subunit ribosomal protein L13e
VREVTRAGFASLQKAGLSVSQARTIGIAVDPRRKNRSEESMSRNVARLSAYKSKLILFPRKEGKPKQGSFVADAKPEELAAAVQHKGALQPVHSRAIAAAHALPESVEFRAITPDEKKASAYATIRRARDWVKKVGVRQKLKQKNGELCACVRVAGVTRGCLFSAEKRKAQPAEKGE